MTTMRPFDFLVPDCLIAEFLEYCRDTDQTPGSVLRQHISLDIRRHRRQKVPKKDECLDEALLARLRRLVAISLVKADSWEQLRRALRAEGVDYAAAGGGLILIDLSSRKKICKASEIGPGYGPLARRFAEPFPGHPMAIPQRTSVRHSEIARFLDHTTPDPRF